MAKRRKISERAAARERQTADVRAKAVETGELRLVDRAGRVRAVLEVTRAGPSLAMMHEDGTVALELVLAGDGPGVRLTDEKGKTRVFVGATRGAARMGMTDGNGSQRLFLGVNGSGTPTLTLYDREQQRVWTTGAKRARARRSAKS